MGTTFILQANTEELEDQGEDDRESFPLAGGHVANCDGLEFTVYAPLVKAHLRFLATDDLNRDEWLAELDVAFNQVESLRDTLHQQLAEQEVLLRHLEDARQTIRCLTERCRQAEGHPVATPPLATSPSPQELEALVQTIRSQEGELASLKSGRAARAARARQTRLQREGQYRSALRQLEQERDGFKALVDQLQRAAAGVPKQSVAVQTVMGINPGSLAGDDVALAKDSLSSPPALRARL
eukprot:EG_transcript_14386